MSERNYIRRPGPYRHVTPQKRFTLTEKFLIWLGYRTKCCAAKIVKVDLPYWPFYGRCDKCRNWV